MEMYISNILLENIRCFERLELNFEDNGSPVLWSTLLGDNSTGKTTFLRCVAIGLCDESSGAGLLRESEEGYIRQGKRKGVIKTTLSTIGDKKLTGLCLLGANKAWGRII